MHFRRHRLFLCKCIEKLQLIPSSDAPRMIFLCSFSFFFLLKILDIYRLLSLQMHWETATYPLVRCSPDDHPLLSFYSLNILKILDIYLNLSFMHIYIWRYICSLLKNIRYLFWLILAKSYLNLFTSDICQLWCQRRGWRVSAFAANFQLTQSGNATKY